MPIFIYEAKDASGRRVKDKLDALDEREVIMYLQRQRMTVERVRPSWRHIELGSSKIKTKELTTMTRMLATLLEASVPLTAALTALYRQAETTAVRKMVRKLLIDVESGDTFATAAKKQPEVFDAVMANMIAAGESSGDLDGLLNRMAIMLERNEATKGEIKGAMVFPAVVLGVAGIAIYVLLVWVLPNFVAMFESSKVPLPWPTRVTMGTSEVLKNYWYLIFGGLIGTVYLYKRLMLQANLREQRDRFLLRLPVFGTIIRKSAIARFSRTFGTLLSSGVNIIEVLQLVEGTTGNIVLSQAISQVRQKLTSGGELGKALEETGVFPPMVVSMVSIGEQTAKLDEMLNRVADYYEEDVTVAVRGAIKLIEPAMMVFIGGIIAIILLSIYLPMFSMLAVFQNG